MLKLIPPELFMAVWLTLATLCCAFVLGSFWKLSTAQLLAQVGRRFAYLGSVLAGTMLGLWAFGSMAGQTPTLMPTGEATLAHPAYVARAADVALEPAPDANAPGVMLESVADELSQP